MPNNSQTRASHRRFIPMWHFFAAPVLIINVFVEGMRFFRAPTGVNGWSVIVALALVIGIFFSRVMPLRAQDRIIRLEERIRFEKVLPTDLRGRIEELTAEQFKTLSSAASAPISSAPFATGVPTI